MEKGTVDLASLGAKAFSLASAGEPKGSRIHDTTAITAHLERLQGERKRRHGISPVEGIISPGHQRYPGIPLEIATSYPLTLSIVERPESLEKGPTRAVTLRLDSPKQELCLKQSEFMEKLAQELAERGISTTSSESSGHKEGHRRDLYLEVPTEMGSHAFKAALEEAVKNVIEQRPDLGIGHPRRGREVS